MKLQKLQLSSIHISTFFLELQRFFNCFIIWTTIFIKILKKIFAVSCVVCKGLKIDNLNPYKNFTCSLNIYNSEICYCSFAYIKQGMAK